MTFTASSPKNFLGQRYQRSQMAKQTKQAHQDKQAEQAQDSEGPVSRQVQKIEFIGPIVFFKA